jgi:hypothetical protein
MQNPDVKLMLDHRGERPVQGTLLRIAYGIPYGTAAWGLHSLYGMVHWHTVPAYAVIGMTMSFLTWGSDRLWYWSVSGFLKRPFGMIAILTKIPLWYVAGGAGYIAGMVIAEKNRLIGFYDIPIRPLFVRGGVIGCCLQLALTTIAVWILRNRFSTRKGDPS